MTEFWIICALLLAVALAFIVLPLLRSSTRNRDVIRDAANLEIFRDQMAEMDNDLANGLLTQEAYEQGKRELQARMLEEVKSLEGSGGQSRNPLKVLALVLVLLVPLGSIGLYLELGNLNVFLPQQKDDSVSSKGFGNVLSADGVKQLQAKLAKRPNDPNEWLQLARSLTQLERYPEAVKAYATLTRMVPNQAQLWAEYANALAMTQGQSLVGRPTQLLDRALSIDPKNANALALSGSAAMERGDYPTAIKDWEALLKQLPPKSQEAKMVAAGLGQARNFMAQAKSGKAPMAQAPAARKPAAKPGKERITGTVELSSALKGKVSPDEFVFVLAKAEQGPPMPLAVIRKQVRDLPLKFSLDDSNAVVSQMKLSNYDKVVVIARVSKSGNPIPQPGDLEGRSTPLAPGKHGLKIDIDHELK